MFGKSAIEIKNLRKHNIDKRIYKEYCVSAVKILFEVDFGKSTISTNDLLIKILKQITSKKKIHKQIIRKDVPGNSVYT